ncbi:MAG: hypothetical protein LC687_00390 [Actinobacteria bacterium]|nr:hypothetical protein [Actinomycetota bacterium]MCA1806328.1 hypothetical protein [Actinomycetota bacterium]
MKQVQDIDWHARETMKRLKHLKPYIHKVALTGSTYIKFEDNDIGSLRISDHPGRMKYSYRWNLFIDAKHSKLGMHVDGNGIRRWYYDAHTFDAMITHIRNYANKIQIRRSIDFEIAYGA